MGGRMGEWGIGVSTELTGIWLNFNTPVKPALLYEHFLKGLP